MSRAVLSIGSNVGDSLAHLQSVVDTLGSRVQAVSAVYATAPWGGIDQQDFLNAVLVAVDPDLDPRGWLDLAHRLEADAHRIREVRWGPRTLDVDIISCYVGEGHTVISTDPELTLPHPRAHERAFVLVPWRDVEPDAPLTVGRLSRPIRDWLADLDNAERGGVRRTDATLRMTP
jgi:2-amino-4-hydroxy-6-hydroxymethyldihydropteridine diphosphokinase